MFIPLGLRLKYFMLTISVLIVAIILQKYYFKYNLFPKVKTLKKGVYFIEDLAVDGKLYLAILGSIYDVTEGKKHYGIGSPYNYFVGKFTHSFYVNVSVNVSSIVL